MSQAPDKRDRTAEAANVARLAAIEVQIAEIDKQLAVGFPDYAALVKPGAVLVEDIQAQLGAGEALLLFLDTPEWKPTPEESFLWVVTKTRYALGAHRAWHQGADRARRRAALRA